MKADLIVVGAGVLGTFHAYHALRQGRSVVLLEKDAMPAGATVRNFGQIVPSGLGPGRWQNLGIESMNLYKGIQSEYDISVRRGGSVYLASDGAEWTLVRDLHLESILIGSERRTIRLNPILRRQPLLIIMSFGLRSLLTCVYPADTFAATGSRILAVLFILLAGLVAPPQTGAQSSSDTILVFSKTAGFRHASIPNGVAMIREIGAENGFAVDHSEDASSFSDETLSNYSAVVFLSTTGDILTSEQQAAFERYVQGGGGFVGIHAAADTEYDWPWYGELVGAYFESHPPGTHSATVIVNDRVHPSTRGLPLRWQRADEWYNYRRNPRGDVHVLLTLDERTYTGGTDGHDHPIAWCRPYDGGRSWYTGGGHTEASYQEPFFREHVRGGLLWAMGIEEGDCSATLNDSFEKTILDDATNDPMELTVLPDGRVVFVERAGRVKIYKPDAAQTVTVGIVDVYTGEEDGLLGITHDPAFATNAWIYLFYSPAGLEAKQRISRFTLSGDHLDEESERILLEIPTQRVHCCHSGGSLAFGPDGSLYASLGDDTNPFESDGFAPIDERPGRSAFDAQRTSGNTQDLRGKIIRIIPEPDGTYSIPEGNLFDAPSAGRPEIFVMGSRNPFRIAVDQERGWLYWGDVGPDSWTDSATRGPRGYDEFNQAREAGNYGWPYCIGDNQPYRDFDFATAQPGSFFDCTNGPLNHSPNNTGAEILPPATPAWIWYPYENSHVFPELNEGGGRTAMAGPVYHFNPLNDAAWKLPEYYDDTVFIYEWSRNWFREVKLDDEGGVLKINPFLSGQTFSRPMDVELGPDGALYVLEWGTGFGGGNNDSRLVRIGYTSGERAPMARVSAEPTSGAIPLTVSFDGSHSFDPDQEEALTFSWDFDNDGVVDATGPTATFTYTERGDFAAVLTVTDPGGLTGTASVLITAGNTRPLVEIVGPAEGGFFDWSDIIRFQIRVSDAEDGSTDAGTIDCGAVTVQLGLGHDDHSHTMRSTTGCTGTLDTMPVRHGGDGSDVYHIIDATYRDRGAHETSPLTGQTTIRLQPKRKEAEHFTTNSGVQFEDTTDPSGGRLNAGWIDHGDHLSYFPVHLGNIDSVTFRVASAGTGGRIEARAGGVNGPIVAAADVPVTGGWQNWTDITATITDPGETHKLFLLFTNTPGATGLFNLNYMEFHGRGVALPVADEAPEELPQALWLGPAYPNPLTSEGRIPFALPAAMRVRLEIFDMLGRRVAVLIDEHRQPGRHEARLEVESMASGLYVYRITTSAHSLSRRLVVLR